MNTENIAKDILDDIRQNTSFGREPFTDEEINNKSKRELLNHYLSWNGISGYTGTIIRAVESIYGIELKDSK